jgi:sugar lactone lactonase YvrE
LQRSSKLVRVSVGGVEDLRIDLEEGSFPFECLLHDGKLFVSLWAQKVVAVFDAETGKPLARIPAGDHPSEMCLDREGKRLFVSNGNENTVSAICLEKMRVSETLLSSLYPAAQPGSTPNALALSPNGKVLLVANADNNNLP